MSQVIKLWDGTALPDVETLTGNSGGAIGPSGGNINVVGDGTTISIVGNPGTSTLTASFIGSTDISITGDTGGAQTGDAFTFSGGTTGLSFGGAADVFTLTFAGITANGGTVSLATDATASTVNIGTGAGAKTVQLGSTNTTSSLALRYGTADFTLASATGTVMNALDTGEITYPLQPAFAAYPSAQIDNVTGDGTLYKIIYNTELFDQNGDFNTGTSEFTAPVTGRYFFSYVGSVGGLTAAHTLGVGQLVTSDHTYTATYMNYASTAGAGASNGIYIASSSWIVPMDAGDIAYTNIGVFNGTKVVDIYAGDVNACFTGYLVC